MSVTDGKPNHLHVYADKPDGEYVGEEHGLPATAVIKTADGRLHQRPAEGWPALGLGYTSPDPELPGHRVYGWPDAMQISPKVLNGLASRGLAYLTGERTVVRPSRPDPDTDENGSAKVADHHHVPDPDNPRGNPPPHVFPQADVVTFRTYDPVTRRRGTVTYDVARNPDKYVAGDETGEAQVTPDVYAAGDTEVEWFYTLHRAATEES